MNRGEITAFTRWSTLTALLVVALVGCDDKPSGAVAVDVPLPWTAVPEWRVGGAEDSIVVLGSLRQHQVVSWDTGQIVIADADIGELLLLDGSGRLIRSRSIAGDGPGELRRPSGLTTTADGELVGIDPYALRLVRWDRDLVPVGEARLPDGAMGEPQIAMSGDQWQVVVTGRDSANAREWRLVRGNAIGQETLAALGRPAYATGDLPTCGSRGISSYPLLTPRIVWASRQGTTASVASAEYRIGILDSLGVRRTITREIVPEPTDSQMAAYHARGRLMNGCPIPVEEGLRAWGFASVVPVVTRMIFSPQMELFVERRVEGKELAIDVFDTDGGYLGTMPDGTPMPIGFVDGGHYLSLDRDSSDVPRLSRWRLTR